MKKKKVLSLFNGMNCIGLALSELGIEFELYASEIDKYANQVSNALFPNTINLGDVRDVRVEDLPRFDLIVAGSPCQGFSFAGEQLNFQDERSKLFFQFVRILKAAKKVNHNIKFLLENVKMKKEYEAVISRLVGIDPIEINSSLLSAQSRKRLYWTNIGTTKANLFGIEEPGIKQPKDKGILLWDVLEHEVDEKYFINMNSNTVQKPLNVVKDSTMNEKSTCIDASYYKGFGVVYNNCRQVVKVGRKLKLAKTQNKASCFTAGGNSGGNHSDMDLVVMKRTGEQWNDAKIRRLTPKECARLQTVPKWAIKKMLTCGVSDSQLYKMLGNGWTIAVIMHLLSYLD